MKFIDLFAGLGGFHIALKHLEIECVFASEIDKDLQNLYEENFGLSCHGDITKIDASDIPPHDILCAGFPCQPFSKAGHQKGLEDTGRGDMIFEIIRILKYHQPTYFILENVPNLKTHNGGETWNTISEQFSRNGYDFEDIILSPHHFGIPNNRDRIFILGVNKYATPKSSVNLRDSIANIEKQKTKIIKDITEYIDKDKSVKNNKKISQKQMECLNAWQHYFIEKLDVKEPFPKFPIWAMEFGANYPLKGKSPYFLTQSELAQYRGAFGVSLKDLSKAEQLSNMPSYAIYKEPELPRWKINYIQKNRDFWDKNKSRLVGFIPKIKSYINSWQKLEWNAGDEGERDIFKYLLQFRSSGIRIKKTSVPSLVLCGTQTPIIGWEKRYLTRLEAQKLQGFSSIQLLDGTESKNFQALGNAVNSEVVKKIVTHFIPATDFTKPTTIYTLPPYANAHMDGNLLVTK